MAVDSAILVSLLHLVLAVGALALAASRLATRSERPVAGLDEAVRWYLEQPLA